MNKKGFWKYNMSGKWVIHLLCNWIYVTNMKSMWIIRTTQRFVHLKPLSIFRFFTHLWGNKLKVENQKNEILRWTKGGKYFFIHEYYFFPVSTLMKIKGMIIKNLIQMTVIYYRYCLFCVCVFPVNNNKITNGTNEAFYWLRHRNVRLQSALPLLLCGTEFFVYTKSTSFQVFSGTHRSVLIQGTFGRDLHV